MIQYCKYLNFKIANRQIARRWDWQFNGGVSQRKGPCGSNKKRKEATKRHKKGEGAWSRGVAGRNGTGKPPPGPTTARSYKTAELPQGRPSSPGGDQAPPGATEPPQGRPSSPEGHGAYLSASIQFRPRPDDPPAKIQRRQHQIPTPKSTAGWYCCSPPVGNLRVAEAQ